MMEKRQETKISSIPEEIVFQVLKELPAKSLLKFRCVSKLWRSIIDDPLFIASHRTRSHTRPGGINILMLVEPQIPQYSFHFFSINPEGGPPVPLQTLPNTGSSDLEQSVNGLFCFGNTVWNPTTREIIDLPPTTIICEQLTDFTKWAISRSCLLGFSPSTNEYKVLAISQIHLTQKFGSCYGKEIVNRAQCKILTLGTTNSLWRDIEIDSLPTQLSNFYIKRVCCVNGTIYCWDLTRLLAFDVGHEKFRDIDYHHVLDDQRHWLYPIPVGECLGLALSMSDPKENKVWILDESWGNWKMESLTVPKGCSDYGQMVTAVGTIHRGDEILLYQRGRGYRSLKLFYYKIGSKSFRRIYFPRLPALPNNNPPYEEEFTPTPTHRVSLTRQVECLFRLKGCDAMRRD